MASVCYTLLLMESLRHPIDSKLKRNIQRLKENSFDRYVNVWHGFGLPNDQQEAFSWHLQEKLLPDLVGNPEKNSFRIAVCLSFIDSRTLKPKLRSALGLAPKPPEPSDMPEYSVYPSLYIPDSGNRWGYQCDMANGRLRYTVNRLDSRLPDTEMEDHNSVAFELLGCLMGKVNGHRSGLCFQTTEFPNGAVFIKDVWYQMPNYSDAGQKLDELAQEANEFATSDISELYSDEHDPIITKNMVVYRNCGGIWQPTRSVYFQDGEDTLDVKDFSKK